MVDKRPRCWMLEAMFHKMAPSASAAANKQRRKNARKGKRNNDYV